MTITGVKIRPLLDNSGFYKAVATVYMGEYAINGILLAEKNGRVVLRFPFLSGKKECGARTFVFAPLSSQARAAIEKEVSQAYWNYQEVVDGKLKKGYNGASKETRFGKGRRK